MGTTDAGRVHGEAIVIDGTCPLANREEFLDEWIRGGATAIAPSLEASTGVDGAMRSIARWLTRIAAHPDKLLHVTRAADVNAAKAQGRPAIISTSKAPSRWRTISTCSPPTRGSGCGWC